MRKSHRFVTLLVALAALAAAGAMPSPGADAGTVPPYDPSKLGSVGDARQLIVVTGRSPRSTYASLHTYRLVAAGTWVPQFAAMPARNGYGGWVAGDRRVQGTGTTPQGTYRITEAFGRKPDPGTKLAYRQVDGNDYWVGDQRDPRTYNTWQPSVSAHRTWRTGEAERLADYPTQYAYAVVIDFNRPLASTTTWDAAHSEHVTSAPANVRLGSAIFLHVNGAGSTAGCVSVGRSDLTAVLRWLDPAMKPRIIMGPRTA
jgi:L,D-peptidoglycan transpeptidase YkuD (ErfK/YbiS/YcfS/YnhG family)